jgi:hypothetical protein
MPTESIWGQEMGWGFQRAVTVRTLEAGCCATPDAVSRPLFAWSDGYDWLDEFGTVGWADWPPPGLEAVAAASD